MHAAVAHARRQLAALGLSVLGGSVCAVVWSSLEMAFLPPEDAKPAESFRQRLAVAGFALEVGALIGCAIAPLVYVCTRKRSLLRAFVFVVGIVLTVIVAVTPFHAWLALGASFLELGLGLVLCVILPSHWLVDARRRRERTIEKSTATT